ncbi:MAG: AAA domain-containing protein, partial [Planctomycetia bacterium]
MGFSARAGGSEEGGPHGSNLQEYDPHGSNPHGSGLHGSNLHESNKQPFAPHDLGLDPLHDSTQAPSLTRLLARWTKESGGRAPRTLAELASACALMREADAITERYDWSLFEEDLEDLTHALAPAARGWGARLWAFVSNSNYRRARRTLRTLRSGSSGGKADVRTLHAEVCEAADLARRWRQELNCEVRELDSLAELLQVHERLSSTHAELRGLVPTIPDENQSFESLHAVLRALETDRKTAFRVPGVRRLQKLLIDAGLGPFLTEARTPLPGVTLRQRFERLIHETQLERIYAQEPALTNFRGPAHEQLIQDFQRLDAERLSLAATRVRLKHARMAIDAMNSYSAEADIVQREASKRARHMPLRKLLEQAPHVLTRVAPCWVASPLSVSQLMAPKAELFDVVIFDEGSQIPPEDAIPALYRAKQVVAAGDQHQMPPTSFFAASTEEEELAEEALVEGLDGNAPAHAITVPNATEGFESLLASLESFLPNRMLEWHYRSEDERLITFSNAEIYDNRLVTFPSARADQAIRHVHVAHDPALAGQQESASREVERVVELVLEHARTRSHESLGVIALSIKHANRLEAAIYKAVQAEPALGPFFDLEREERFFVKNLERVQGDERDAIILSIGHGKSPDGTLPMRFGPLLVEGGYRRLNVAITRAKRRMTLVSSFLPHDIDLARTRARGVVLLKAYLEYAVNGGTRFVGTERADEIPLNAFESDIRGALEARGILLRGQFGASRFRIDLVAMHPERRGQPILAIECDGASYHSGATARDRDRIRQMQLGRLGWVFHRIWSTDWFQNREREIERALQAYQLAVRRADEGGQSAATAGNATTNSAA